MTPRHVRRSLVSSLALAAACSNGAPPPATPPPAVTASPAPARPARAASSAGFAVVPLHLRALPDAGRAAEVELRADGTVIVNGQVVLRIEARRALAADGHELIAVAEDGTITANGQTGRARMAPDGTVFGRDSHDAETRFEINADGIPVERHADGRTEALPVHFENLAPDARGTAMLLVLSLLMPTQTGSSAPEASASAPAVMDGAPDLDATAVGGDTAAADARTDARRPAAATRRRDR